MKNYFLLYIISSSNYNGTHCNSKIDEIKNFKPNQFNSESLP